MRALGQGPLGEPWLFYYPQTHQADAQYVQSIEARKDIVEFTDLP